MSIRQGNFEPGLPGKPFQKRPNLDDLAKWQPCFETEKPVHIVRFALSSANLDFIN